MSYFWNCGEALDQFLNVVLLDGDVGETISMHAAKSAEVPKVWACVLCRWLSWTVETNHCDKTLGNAAISRRGGLLAGMQLFAVFLALTFAMWWWL